MKTIKEKIKTNLENKHPDDWTTRRDIFIQKCIDADIQKCIDAGFTKKQAYFLYKDFYKDFDNC